MRVYELIKELIQYDPSEDVQIEIDLSVDEYGCSSCGKTFGSDNVVERVNIIQVYKGTYLTLDCEMQYTPK